MMTTLCKIVLTVVSCTVDPSTPAPTPQDAVAIITASLGPSRVPPPSFAPGWVDVPLVQTDDRDWPVRESWAPTFAPTLDTSLYAPSPWLWRATGFRSGLYGRSSRGNGRNGTLVNRQGEHNRPAEHRAGARSPAPPNRPTPSVRTPIAASGGSVRTKVGKD